MASPDDLGPEPIQGMGYQGILLEITLVPENCDFRKPSLALSFRPIVEESIQH